jgi:hypothetical protein
MMDDGEAIDAEIKRERRTEIDEQSSEIQGTITKSQPADISR